MLIHAQFPIVDLRGLIGSQDTRLPVPSWPTPLEDEEFIRSTGIIRKRRKGGLQGYIAEERYCDARRSIKLDYKAVARAGLGPWNFRVAFRRFYFDGTAVAKFEIGFTTGRGFAPLHHNALNELVSALLTLPVRVARPDKELFDVCRLIESGNALANFYTSASSRHRGRGPITRFIRWKQRRDTGSLVIAGTPAVFIEIAPQDIDATNLPNRIHRMAMKDTELNLFYWRDTIGGRSFPVWTAVHPDYKEIAEVRNLRIYMLRLNAENQSLIRVLKALNSGQIKPEPRSTNSGVLQAYLNEASSRILDLSAKSREFAAGNDKLLSLAAAAAESFLSAEERQSALSQLESLQIRKNIFHNIKKQETLEDLNAVLKLDETTHSINIRANTINIFGGIKMSKQGERLTAVLFGAAFLVALLVLAIMFPQPTSFQYDVFRVVLSVAAAGFVSMTPGFIQVSISNWLRAGGALAVFAVVYFFSPAALVANP
jgi:hypothetical protein